MSSHPQTIKEWLIRNPDPFPEYQIEEARGAYDYNEAGDIIKRKKESNERVKKSYLETHTVAEFNNLVDEKNRWDNEKYFFIRDHPVSHEKPFLSRLHDWWYGNTLGTKRGSNKRGSNKRGSNKRGSNKRGSNKRGSNKRG